MHSGGAQQFGQRSQPAQSYFTGLGCTFIVYAFAKAILLPPSAPRVGGILGASSAQACV